MLRPSGSTAVMARRVEPPDSLDFFPTPPWAARAGAEIICGVDPYAQHGSARMCWEPACGEGHMAHALDDYFDVFASDVFAYGFGAVADFLDPMWDRGVRYAWIITNPPFATAADFAELALQRAKRGVGLLVRTAWLEGGKRYERIFSKQPPTIVAQSAERVPMTKGRWDPGATTATAYCWVIWLKAAAPGRTELRWIAPGCRERLSKPSDLRFAVKAETPLFSAQEEGS